MCRAIARRCNGRNGVHHWLVALHENDDSREAVDCRQALAYGGTGSPISEDEVRDRTTRRAREDGRPLVSVEDIEAVVRAAWRR